MQSPFYSNLLLVEYIFFLKEKKTNLTLSFFHINVRLTLKLPSWRQFVALTLKQIYTIWPLIWFSLGKLIGLINDNGTCCIVEEIEQNLLCSNVPFGKRILIVNNNKGKMMKEKKYTASHRHVSLEKRERVSCLCYRIYYVICNKGSA